MYSGRKRLVFCCAEEDSLYAAEYLRQEKKAGNLSEQESLQLKRMEKRILQSRVYLAPSVIYAAANQENAISWLEGSPKEQRDAWYAKGVVWMKRCPAFLEKFGWKERHCALLAAGIIAQAENGNTAEDWDQVCRLLCGGWSLLWERMKRAQVLDACQWQEMMGPWEDSACMGNGMAGVMLLMAILLEKPVSDLDQLWRPVQRLRAFTEECRRAPSKRGIGDDSFEENEKMIWLLSHFKNPQRPAYIREKERYDSEWLEQLYQIMALAGLPISACETMHITFREVQQILEQMEDGKLSEKQYMTYLMLYAVSRELANAGRAAAALEAPDTGLLRTSALHSGRR